MTAAELITAATGVIDDLGLTIVFVAGAIVGLAAYVLRRVKSASR